MTLPRRKKRQRTKPAPDRIRCEGHLKWVRRRYICAIGNHDCGGKTEAAHIRRGTDGGIGLKPSDRFTIPLCSHHHAEQHRDGEETFERRYGAPGWMLKMADALWRESSHGKKYRREMETSDAHE